MAGRHLVGIKQEYQNTFRMALVQLYMMKPQKPSYRKVPLNSTPIATKPKQKPCLKYFKSSEHSIKTYADDTILISYCLETHTKVLQQVDFIWTLQVCVIFVWWQSSQWSGNWTIGGVTNCEWHQILGQISWGIFKFHQKPLQIRNCAVCYNYLNFCLLLMCYLSEVNKIWHWVLWEIKCD